MIETMNKLYLLLHNKNIDDVLDKMQDLGVVHIKQDTLDPEQFQEVYQKEKRVGELLKFCAKQEMPQSAFTKTVDEHLDDFENILRNIDELNSEKSHLSKDFNNLRPWGYFTQELVKRLAADGVDINFYVTSSQQFNKLDLEKINHEIIHQESGQVYFVTIRDKISLEEIALPSQDLKAIEGEIERINKEIDDLKTKALSFAAFKNAFQDFLLLTTDKLSIGKAKAGFQSHYDSFSSAIGWIPESRFEEFVKESKKIEGFAFLKEKDISKEAPNQIPILLKNSKFSKLFEPITKLFALPNYAELDLTPFFAPFFVMFFGLSMADAGYGVVMFLATLFGLFKAPKEYRGMILLVSILSLSTIFWGLLTGTTFGIDAFKTNLPVISNLATFTPDHTFYLALLIGLVQILFGMGVQFYNRFIQGGFLSGLSTIGWMILVFFLTTTYLGAQPIVENSFTIGVAVLKFSHMVPATLGKIGMALGAFLILFFNDMKVNIFMRFGKGLWELYGITGVFGDLLSYIRLFALGISSAILGTVINSIGSQFLEIDVPILSHLLFLGFVIIGHTTNLGLAMLGSFVHPLRLTFVEFYKNAGFAGGGLPYSPLKKSFDKNISKGV